ncbi:threonine aldolase family protein [Epibacterium ulvae]|uniref:threonine aldolase family protein n=1 Tax=Epibacterium ulvae TaxID=1156985 RepID=UPI00249108CA|nr:beta-eliminating lyase-related protein [Epibacterium ulvae]
MYFASDNSGPASSAVMTALIKANEGYRMGYGADTEMEEVRARIRAEFEAPDAAVYLVTTGTAANALALATLGQSWQTVFCTAPAHIQQDECNAPEFFTGGAKLTLVSPNAKMTTKELRSAIEAEGTRGVHGPQRGPVSITQVTEHGTVYSLNELQALSSVAKEYNLPVHLDGARFANALVALGCTPAEMTWKSGIDAVSFGGTKNGLMGVEAVIFFDPKHAWEFELRRKRGAHLLSKHRFLSAQMLAYLTDDLWRENARNANAHATTLATGLKQCGVELAYPQEANLVFPRMSRRIHNALLDAGAVYHLWGGSLESPSDEVITARCVCDWSTSKEAVQSFLELLKRVTIA